MPVRWLLPLLVLCCMPMPRAWAVVGFDAIVFRSGFDAYACPNGATEDAETCDDGSAAPGDGCSEGCRVEFGYYCDGTPSICVTSCGDGAPAGTEDCDDGDADDDDGCSAQCTVEPGYECNGIPSVCTFTCFTQNGTSGDNTLVGTSGDDCLFGFEGNDTLQGNAGNDDLDGGEGNDHLDGGEGTDTLVGLDGSDTYIVDSAGDVVDETGPSVAFTDTVVSSVSYTLGPNLENLTLAGTAQIDGTGNELDNAIAGNSGNNVLSGAGGDDTLTGNAGDDTLDGGAGNDTLNGLANGGADTMSGGTGNDLYIVGTGDTISETSTVPTEIDSVSTSISFTLGPNLENLDLTGATGVSGTGNSLANQITGNDGTNLLRGFVGNDTLVGGAGDDTLAGGLDFDTLTGGAGSDQFLVDFTFAANNESVTDFVAGTDEMAFDMSAMSIGNGDTTVTGTATSGTWTPTLELVIDTSNLTGLGTATVGAEFSSANAPVAVGSRLILVADTGASTGVYLFVSDGDADVETAELTTLATLAGTPSTAVSDFVFVP